MLSLSTADSELHAAVKTGSEGLGIQSVAKDLGIACGSERTSGCHSDDVPGQSQRIVLSETCRHADLVDTSGLQVRKVRHEESGNKRELR